jgi:ABC-2 type transport system ATP-binding protein
MDILSVQSLSKKYEKFTLDRVSFSLESGYIMGFIGRNGAGKSTTLKSILGIVHPDGGKVYINGLEFSENELECKQNVGLVMGEVNYYPKKTLRTITDVTRRFYKNWNENEYKSLMLRFGLDESKKVCELSAGMKVKYSLALALSHEAKLLILDEPTSGLDPVSRDDLLELFQEIIEDGEHSILFSTHITSDLEKCADFITYIKNGRIIASTDRETFAGSYRILSGGCDDLYPALKEELIGLREHKFGFNGMIETEKVPENDKFVISQPSLEDIMVYIEREGVE